MPIPLILGAVLGEEALVAGVALLTRVLFVGSAAGTGYVLHKATEEKAAPATGADTTTIVGKGQLNCGDNGNYDDMLKKNGDGKLDRDHVPSKGALKEAAKQIIENTPSLLDKMTPERWAALLGKGSDPGLIAKQGKAIAIPKKDHQQHSRTYAGRNNEAKIKGDAENLQEAAKKDTKTIEEGEGKEMDDECLNKYKKAAEEINKKTHEEYVKELTDLIKDVIKRY